MKEYTEIKEGILEIFDECEIFLKGDKIKALKLISKLKELINEEI